MAHAIVRTLQGVIALALLGSLVVQGLVVPLLWVDLDGAPSPTRLLVVVLVVVGVGTLQVTAVCIWRLLSMVRRDTVFSRTAFRYVDVVIAAVASGSGVVLGLAVVAAHANRTGPGDVVAPGIVGIICGIALVVAGVALVVLVLRVLLAQAVALDSEARYLRAELGEVI